ncbi:MAG TPA: hypothetical protein ENL42_05240 [Thermoplasmatales archaeon]|nr:hypothetical protein [Thermoplasmatales archaeon]
MKKYLATLFLIPILFFIASEAKGAVFAEELTSTTCHACPAVADILHEIYASGDYPFYYVAMVADKNDLAAERATHYNLYGYPTTFFDGGYEVVFGKQAKENFENAIESCLERERAKIRLSLSLRWLGENRIEVRVAVENTGNDKYDGTLRIYIVEPVSRWKDNEGRPYHFGFLDYAINEEISLEANEEMRKEVIWDGGEKGYEISKDNIMAIAAVFNKQGVTRYSDPPNNNRPFTAHFVDACTAAEPAADEPPTLYFTKKPDSVVGYRNVSFKWYGEDDFGDVLFSYMLKGYETTWHEWSSITSANYTNLPDGEYEFLLRGKDNVGQITEISWKFVVDTSPPYIVEHYPENNARNVPVYATIRIKFSHEMDKQSVEKGIEIKPSIQYTIEWRDSNEIIIHPYELSYETLYTVTIKNARRTSGQEMKEYSFSFETSSEDTSPPSVVSFEPSDGEYLGEIRIRFSEPMNTFIHRGLEINPWVRYTHDWEDNDTTLVIKFLEIKAGNYTITVTKYMEDKYGNGMESNFSFNVSINYPRIVYTSIENGEKNVDLHSILEIHFSHEMDRESVEKNMSIVPQCNYDIEWNGSIMKIYLELDYGKTYYINISGEAVDILGLPLKNNFSLHFSTLKEIERDIETNEAPSFSLIAVLIAFLVIMRRKLK